MGENWEKFPVLYKSSEESDNINITQIKGCPTTCPVLFRDLQCTNKDLQCTHGT